MSHFKNAFLLVGTVLIGLFVFAVSTNAQTPQIQKSDSVFQQNGRPYYVHLVQKGQTFFSICKAYQCDAELVQVSNPGLVPTDLTLGQIILIPAPQHLLTAQPSTSAPVQTDEQFFYHTVQKGQTMYYIHKKYNVPIDVILLYNPSTKDNPLSIGQVIRIPRKKELAPNTTPLVSEIPLQQPDTNYHKYIVRPGETLYSLSKRFEVTIADIIQNNPALRYGLKADQLIRIPFESGYVLSEAGFDTLFQILRPELSAGNCDSIAYLSKQKEVKVAIMLPFFAEKIMTDTVLNNMVDTLPYKNIQALSRITDNSLEFYEGLILAADSIRNTGKKVTFFVYDTRADSNVVQNIFYDLDIVQPDIIIGPAYKYNVEIVAKYTLRKNIIHVLPFISETSIIQEHPTAYQVLPSVKSEQEFLARYLANNCFDNTIVIHKADSTEKVRLLDFELLVDSYRKSASIDELFSPKYIEFSNNMLDSLVRLLSKDTTNTILFSSNYEAEVNTVLSLLNNFSLDYRFNLIGKPIWQVFRNVRIDPMHKVNTTFFTPFYIDYTHPACRDFLQKSRSKLGYEPYEKVSNGSGFNFAMLGYEVGLIFMDAYATYGKDLPLCSSFIDQPLFESNYKFTKIAKGGGFENQSGTLIQFSSDYTVKVLKKE